MSCILLTSAALMRNATVENPAGNPTHLRRVNKAAATQRQGVTAVSTQFSSAQALLRLRLRRLPFWRGRALCDELF